MTICPLFLGAELYYNDMHLAFFEEKPAPARNVIEINHCRVGRYECSFGENSCCYLAAGDFAVCAAARKKSSSCFPLRHYHGITILLDLDKHHLVFLISPQYAALRASAGSVPPASGSAVAERNLVPFP